MARRKYIEKSWTVEHGWTCGHCGFKNKGRDSHCVPCGKPIDASHKEEVPEDMSEANAVTDTSIFDDTRPDWFCGYCPSATRNRASRETCNECGSVKGTKKGVAASGQDTTNGNVNIDATNGSIISNVKVSGSGKLQMKASGNSKIKNVRVGSGESKSISSPRTDSKGEPEFMDAGIRNHNYEAPTSSPSPPYPPESSKDSEPFLNPLEPVKTVTVGTGYRQSTIEIPSQPLEFEDIRSTGFSLPTQDQVERALKFIVPGLLVILAIALCVYFFSWHKTIARVEETSWHAHVSLHSRVVLSGHDWRNNEPAHSYNESCHTEIRSYHNCHPHNCNPHQVSYDCNCRTITTCHPHTTCQNVCTSRGNRSSSCHRECETDDGCNSTQRCGTCYRTEYDTCYDRCPDYDQMCEYQYPSWGETNHADTSQMDHTIVRPDLNAPGNVSCPGDEEELFIQNNQITQCTVYSVSFCVTWDAGTDGHYATIPTSTNDYDRFVRGRRWSAQYNHAGMFEPLHPL